ncbi:FAD-dependent thymidylate synthase [Acetobacter persici]|uniref:Flavin-dependent thymidylate synthase n=1 Tax=Acetobacter persici TaxID=1076596 RepID=A0A1U9LK03_9PROT|nr:FAD-dependent thymidylate synthase [Acetobacter persici]AQT06737.1 FAD-dependent thymidylate synthase [Acetobacter persici]
MKDLGLTPIQGEKFAHQARVSSPQMDDILGLGWPVLDHGFVRVVDYMGNEGAIVQAARVSYGIGTQSVSEDRGLLRYLMRHRHSSPFEMCEIKFHIKLPIFIARQWIRHRMASVNEYSARYSILANEFYLPAPEHIATQSKSNKQGRGEMVTPEVAQDVIDLLRADAERNFKNYEDMINPDGDKQLARELARINLTLNTYTEWYWKIDLHNLLHFLRLRVDGHAQFEIRAYAEVILKILMAWVPSVHEAWEDYAFHAHTFSRQEMGVVRLITDIAVKAGLTRPEVLNMAQEHGLSGREARIFADAVFSDQKMVTA